MYSVATRDPAVRRAWVEMPDWPRGAPSIRVALLSDIHVAGPDMPPARLARIVQQVNGLRPDLVLLAGDFVSDKRIATRRYSAAVAIAPLARLKAPLGVVSVLGNHDHWRGRPEIVAALRDAGIRVLENEALAVGPLSVGGVDDAFNHRHDIARTVAAMRKLAGSRVILTHSPDVAPTVPADLTLLLAGHTHCGQIRFPVVGAISFMSEHGDRFACGLQKEGRLRVITSAGIGTSILPLRLGASPDVWLLTLGPMGLPKLRA
jgi:predicted MPP superfamily phosphohydrolase